MTNTSFSQMRKQSQNLATLQNKIKNQGKKDYTDNRYWTAEQDKAGNAEAVIRFLPSPKGEENPFVKLWTYAFQGPTGQWLIENCPSTIGQPSPILEANNELWASKDPEQEKIARKRGRKVQYHANVLVVKDPANPENEGKVFLFKFGVKLYEKIESAMVPKFQDQEPINVFDPWGGADFKLRIVRKDKYANYDNSVFDNPAPIGVMEDGVRKELADEEIEKIWEAEHSLQEIVAEDKFKSYEDLKKRFDMVTGSTTRSAPATAEQSMNTVEQATSRVAEADDGETLDDLDLDVASDMDDLDDFKALVE